VDLSTEKSGGMVCQKHEEASVVNIDKWKNKKDKPDKPPDNAPG
jgi:hypothetical protein